MKLYSLDLSPYAARVRGAIYAKNLPIEIVTPPADWRESAEFRAINPLMRIPALVLDNGAAIPESAVIVEYLEDAFPEPGLRPKSPETLARARLITQILDLYVMPAIMPLFYLFEAKERDQAAIDAQLGKLDQCFAQLDGLLTPGTYAVGDKLSTADVWMTPVRFTLDGLMGFADRYDLLNHHKAIAAYAAVAQNDSALGRVWGEMSEGLKAMMAGRAA